MNNGNSDVSNRLGHCKKAFFNGPFRVALSLGEGVGVGVGGGGGESAGMTIDYSTFCGCSSCHLSF